MKLEELLLNDKITALCQTNYYVSQVLLQNLTIYSQVKRTPQDYINEFIIRKLNLLVVVDFRFISAFLHARNEP